MVLSWRVKSSGGTLFRVNVVHKSIGRAWVGTFGYMQYLPERHLN